MKMDEAKYLIWSVEHGRWWKFAACGYTPHRELAGRYTLEEATRICEDANRHIPKDDPPQECIVPA